MLTPGPGQAPEHEATPGELLDQAVADGQIPGAVLLAGRRDARPLLAHVTGDAQHDGAARRPMTADTIFDLASVTKVVATLPCLLALAGSGELGLDDPVRRYLPAFAGDGKDAVTTRQLLTHTAGLPAHREYYKELDQPDEALAAALAEPLAAAPGTVVTYSDISMIVAGQLAVTIAGAGLEELTRQLVTGPLGMPDTGYRPAAALARRIAATEPAGGVAKVGVVHDENAELLGGVAGHAGVFATAADLARYAAAWTGHPPADWAVPAVLAEQALACQTDGLGGRRGLGWGLRFDRWDNMGDGWPAAGSCRSWTGNMPLPALLLYQLYPTRLLVVQMSLLRSEALSMTRVSSKPSASMYPSAA
jgi:CubicO group peptidase (beta-lactamase class C family)